MNNELIPHLGVLFGVNCKTTKKHYPLGDLDTRVSDTRPGYGSGSQPRHCTVTVYGQSAVWRL